MSPCSATVFAHPSMYFLAFAREMIPPLHHVHGFEKILSSAQDGRLPTTESIVSNIQTGKIVHVFGSSHLLLKLVPTSTCLPSHHSQSQVQNLYPFLLPSSNWSFSPLCVMKTHSGNSQFGQGLYQA
jgi:hypothetical protein